MSCCRRVHPHPRQRQLLQTISRLFSFPLHRILHPTRSLFHLLRLPRQQLVDPKRMKGLPDLQIKKLAHGVSSAALMPAYNVSAVTRISTAGAAGEKGMWGEVLDPRREGMFGRGSARRGQSTYDQPAKDQQNRAYAVKSADVCRKHSIVA